MMMHSVNTSLQIKFAESLIEKTKTGDIRWSIDPRYDVPANGVEVYNASWNGGEISLYGDMKPPRHDHFNYSLAVYYEGETLNLGEPSMAVEEIRVLCQRLFNVVHSRRDAKNMSDYLNRFIEAK
jgi:hypothetical protein